MHSRILDPPRCQTVHSTLRFDLKVLHTRAYVIVLALMGKATDCAVCIVYGLRLQVCQV